MSSNKDREKLVEDRQADATSDDTLHEIEEKEKSINTDESESRVPAPDSNEDAVHDHRDDSGLM